MMRELARRAVGCKHWRWLPGMSNDEGERVLEVSFAGAVFGVDFEFHETRHELGDDALPDLTDSATLGCLLALVREAYSDPTLYCRITDGRVGGSEGPFAWEFNGRTTHGWGWRTEAETLVSALEAAS